MRILMLGNSFTFTNDMPQMLADLTGAEGRGAAGGTAQSQDKTGRQNEGRLRGRTLGFRHSPGDEPRAHLLASELFHQREATL